MPLYFDNCVFAKAQKLSIPLMWVVPRANSLLPWSTRKCFLYPRSTSPLQPRHPSLCTMLPGSTQPRMTAFRVALLQSGTASVWILLSRLKMPKTMGFPNAPRPRFPLTMRAPKKLSPSSTSPSKGDWASQCRAMREQISVAYLLTVFLFSPVRFLIWTALRSRAKSFISCRNLASEIFACFANLFFVGMTGF